MRARGYILVETMVALLVLALVLGGVLEAISGSVHRQRVALGTRRALMVARSQMDAVGNAIPVAAGPTTGLAEDVAWRVDVDLLGGPTPVGTLARITVSAGPPAGPPGVRLSELRLLPPHPPGR